MPKFGRKQVVISLAVLMLVTFGTLLVLQNIVPARTMVIEVSGTPGQKVKATVVVDGESRTELAEIPTRFSFQASQLTFSIVPVENPPGKNLMVTTFIDGTFGGSCSSPAVKGTIIGNSLLNLDRGSQAFAGMTPDEIALAQ